MAKVKGWSRTMELPYRIDYNSTVGNYNKSVGLGETGLIIRKELKDEEWSHFYPRGEQWTGRWLVHYRKYVSPTGQTYKDIGTFDTKEEAISFAVKFMKSHPQG